MAEAADPSSVQVISAQPQPQQSTSAKDTEGLYNGEEIIFEATCDTNSLKWGIRQNYCCAGLQPVRGIIGVLVVGLCLLFICVPLAFYCSERVSHSWRLFLTRSQLHYIRKHESHLGNIEIHLDLSDINYVCVQNAFVDTGCCSAQNLPLNVVVALKSGCKEMMLQQIEQGFADYTCVQFVNNIVLITFTHCANAEEFVQAVQRQIRANQ